MFNKKQFSKILIKAIGNNTIKEFALSAGIDRSYLSKYINCKRDVPLKPNLLAKIAKASSSITYEQLIEHSGLIDRKQFYGHKLEELRANRTYDEYAAILNIEPGTLERLEKGIDPPSSIILLHIAKHENITLEYFYNYSGDKTLYYKDYSSKSEDTADFQLDQLDFLEDDIKDWLMNPEHKDYIEFIYKACQRGITKDQLKFAKILIDI